MRQVWIERAGGPETLALRTLPDPAPGPGRVRVRVHAVGVNFADVMMRLGIYPDAPSLPAVPGYEVSGVIDAVGEGVDPARAGEAVIAFCRFGGYGEAVCVPEAAAFPLPAGVGFAAGAGLVVNFVTAWQMLEVMAPVRPGMTVLVHGAAGGVGLAAVQLCRRRGARVVGAASPAKHAFLSERGVEAALDSRAERYAATVHAVTGGRGVDLVLEPRNGRWIMESYRCLAPTGRLLLFGFSDATTGGLGARLGSLRTLARVPWLGLNPLRLMNDNRGVMGVNVGRLWDHGAMVAGWIRELLALLAAGEIAPHVDRAFPLAEAGRAHRHLELRRNVGKVLLATEAGLAAGLDCPLDAGEETP